MEIPLKEIVFNEGNPGLGVLALSLVKDPAIRQTKVYFSAQKPLKIIFSDEEKGIFFAPALIPDMKIYRNQDGEEFNLTVSKDTIQKIAVDFFKNNRANQINLEHKEVAGQPDVIDGVTIFQALLTDEHTVPTVKGYEDLPLGTLFFGAKVTNPQIKQGIKDGTFTGWSIHAMFESRQVKLTEVKVAADNSLFVDGEVVPGSLVYNNRPCISLINGIKSEIKSLVWENQITLEDGTVLTLADGKIVEVNKPISNTELAKILNKQ
jgi:hypothetical protein